MRDARSRPDPGRQPGHELPEAAVADGGALRADHDHVGRPLAGRRTQRLAVQGFGLAGLRRPHHMDTRRQAAQRGADENQRHHHGDPPDRQHAARPPRASRRQPFGQANRTAAFRWLRDDARFAGGIGASGLRRYGMRRRANSQPRAWRVMAYLIRIPGRIVVHRGLLCCALTVRRQRAAGGYWTGPISAPASSA